MITSEIKYIPAGETAILVKFGDAISEEINRLVRSFVLVLKSNENYGIGIVEFVPAYTDVLVYYDLHIFTFQEIIDLLKELVLKMDSIDLPASRLIEIPVCYGGKYGEDLNEVAQRNKLTEDEVIRIHSSSDYLIYMLGFTPGFAYLGGLDKRIATPRREQPRTIIQAGSVGIAGDQTGIYPIESPGGWQLIGRTPLRLFDPENETPFLFEAGDKLRFVPIDGDEYFRIEQLVEQRKFKLKFC